MVTLQILVLSFLVRIQVAQQSGRFFDRFFCCLCGCERVVPTCVVLGEWPTMQASVHSPCPTGQSPLSPLCSQIPMF